LAKCDKVAIRLVCTKTLEFLVALVADQVSLSITAINLVAYDIVIRCKAPHGAGAPLPSFSRPCPFTSPSCALCSLFPFSFSRSLYLFSSFVHPIPFSTTVVPLRFQAGGRRRRPNLGLVCSVYFV